MNAKSQCVMAALCIAWGAARGFAAGPNVSWPETLRAVRIHEDAFDYVLTAYAAAGDGRWTLSINHREGQTHFVQVGDRVGAYRVVAFEPTEARVFVPSVNAWQTRKSGRATLDDSEGRSHVLVMGRVLDTPGWRASLVSLVTGAVWNVREGDALREAGDALSVVRIAPDEPVQASFNERPVVIPLADPEDNARLATLWRQQAETRQRQEQWAAYQRAKVAEEAREPERVEAHPYPPPHDWASVPVRRPDWFFGTEYRYPSEYEVRMLRQGPDGAWRPFVVPRTFETRRTGFGSGSVGYGGYAHEMFRSHAAPAHPYAPSDSARPREMVPPYAAPMVPPAAIRRP